MKTFYIHILGVKEEVADRIVQMLKNEFGLDFPMEIDEEEEDTNDST